MFLKTRFSKYFEWIDANGIHVAFTIRYKFLFFLLSLPYLIWEIYWANRVGYACIKWHTHLMVYLYLWMLGYLLIAFLFPTKNSPPYINTLLIFSTVIVTLCLVEFLFFAFKTKETTIESFGNGYYSWHDSSHENWYRSGAPHTEVWLTKGEYRYQRITNSLGFSDIEWENPKQKNEHRILALGDSYTEGDGAPFDSSYVTLLRTKFKATDSNISIMNAGTCGNDPFVNFVNYRDRLLKYQPDEIVQTLSSGDLMVDIMVRGGMERFQKNGKVKYKPAPWWEPLYAVSYNARLFFSALGYDQLLLKKSDITVNKKELDAVVIDLFKRYAAVAQQQHSKLHILLVPFRDEIVAGKYNYDFNYIQKELQAIPTIQVFDMLPFYIAESKRNSKPIQSYYWPIDGHPNSKGYGLMADGIYSYLIQEKKN